MGSIKLANPIKKFIKGEGLVPIIRTLGCIGDSLSSGEHESRDENNTPGYNDYYEYSWGQFIARKCGLTARNFSKGGFKAIDFFTTDTFNDMFDKENLCQAYIIALGENDVNHLLRNETYSSFGELETALNSTFEDNLKTFTGCYINLVNRILENQPKARIFLVSNPKNVHDSKQKAELKKKHAKLLNDIAKKYNYTYVLDLNKYDVNYGTKKFDKAYFLGGHLSAAGYKRSADLFITYIDYIIRHNVDDFRQIGFVLKGGEYNKNYKW